MNKGIILVGGPSVGTRFRPLSMDCPKPLFPIAGNPIIYHHVNALAKIPGMREILIIGFFEQSLFDRFLTEAQIEFPFIQIRYLREYQQMGTAGGLHHFRDEILRGNPDSFFVLNGDIACSFPLEQMLKTHTETKAVGTMLSIRLEKEKVSKYGCIVIEESTKQVLHFVEKPESFVSDIISCGVYCFTGEIFQYINQSIEAKRAEDDDNLGQDSFAHFGRTNSSTALTRSDRVQLEQNVIPLLTGKNMLYSHIMSHTDFWMAIKTGSSTIDANSQYLQYFLQSNPRRLSQPTIAGGSSGNSPAASPAANYGPQIIPPVYIHPTAVVHPTAKIGPNVAIGPRALIGNGVRVRDALILDGVEIKHDSCVLNAVVGWDSKVGAWCRIEGSAANEDINETVTNRGFKNPTACIFGKGVSVSDELIIRDCIVLPHKELKHSFHKEILM